MNINFPTTKYFLCTDGTTVFHFGRVDAGQQLSTGQMDTEIFDTEAALNARLVELGQDPANFVPASPAPTPESVALKLNADVKAWLNSPEFDMDPEARDQYLVWLTVDPTASAAKKAMIVEMLAWVNGVWNDYYYVEKAKIMAGDLTIRFDKTKLTPCPYTFQQVKDA